MAEVCKRGYVVITKDKDLLSKTNSLMIWHRSKGRIFQLASGVADRNQIIFALLTALRKMEEIITHVPPPFVVRVLIAGNVEVIRPADLNLPFLSD
jgi:predicted nuclease of predicted toxin-antitoxin system